MKMTPKEYQEYVKNKQEKSPMGKDMLLSFLVGGGICVVGQLIQNGWLAIGLAKDDASTATAISMVFLSALFTGLGLYHKLARHAGAGTLVPITGFANSVVSPAIDSNAEGPILGIGAKIFTVSGPVLLYGTLAGAVYGVLYWLVGLIR